MKTISHLYLDFSSVQAFKECPRKFFLTSIKQLVPAGGLGDESLAANFKGTLVHLCLDAVARGADWEAVFEAAIPEDAAMRFLEPGNSGSVPHLKRLVREYLAHYANDGFQIISTEQTMKMPLTDRVTWQGTMDKIILDSGGVMRALDHKTSSSIKTWVAPTVAISDQFTGYIALARANGFPVENLVVDGISTAFKALQDRQGLFVRLDAERSQEQLDDFRKRMIAVGEEMIDFIESYALFQDNISLPMPGCNSKGGRCPFLDVCTASGGSRKNMLRNSFIQNPNPWKNFSVSWTETEAA